MEKQFRLAETPRALREHSGLRAVGMNGARVVSGREMTIRRRIVEGRPGVIAISGVFPLARMRSEWFSSGGFGFRGISTGRIPTMPVSAARSDASPIASRARVTCDERKAVRRHQSAD